MLLIKIIFIFILTLFIVSCGGSSTNNITSSNSIIHEKSGKLNNTSTHPEQTLIFHLESTKTHKNDTHQIGFDTYTVTINEAHTREYCLVNDQGAGHHYTIEDEKGTIRLDISTGCNTINLTPGLYTHKIYNGTIDQDQTHSVFIYPSLKNTLSNPNTKFKTLKRNVTPDKKILSSIQETNLLKQTTISFNICSGCNLEKVNLSKLAFDSQFEENLLAPRMNAQYFTSLNTNEGDFFQVQNEDTDTYKVKSLDLTEANLKNANLSYSIFRNANFSGVNFEEANLSHAVFIGCTFQGATFNNTDMTRAVFIDSNFNKTYTSVTRIISQPSITRLFQNETTSFSYDLITAINSNNRVSLTKTYGTHKPYASILFPIPEGIRIVSPPIVVANNFSKGYSIFVKASDGFIYEYLNHGTVPGPGPASRMKNIWYKLSGTNICKSNPDATYLNFEDKELTIILACHNTKGTLYTWERRFLNKPNTTKDSIYQTWKKTTHTMPTTNAEISINRDSKIAYVESDILTYYNYIDGNHVSKQIRNLTLSADLRTESNEQITFIKEDGNVYVGNSIRVAPQGLDNPFINIGHPPSGSISTPTIGSLPFSKQPLRVIVLSGDGKLYATNSNGMEKWSRLTDEITPTPTHQFSFTKNNLTETYFENVNFSHLDISSNKFTKTFFTNVKLTQTSFDGATLDEIVFDASLNFFASTFKSSTLNKVQFTNHKDTTNDKNENYRNIVSLNFTGAQINGLTWTNNIASNTIFNEVTFGEEAIISHENRFIGTSIATFNKAENVPVELLYQLSTEQTIGQSAEVLRVYDFTSTNFSNSFYSLNFKNTNMKGAKFGSDVHSQRVDFSNIDATGSSWENADLSFLKCGETEVSGCIFDHSTLNNTNLYQAQMNNSSFNASQWTNTNASFAQFQNNQMNLLFVSDTSDITHTSFNNSTLFQSKLDGLKLDGTTFNAAKLACSSLSGVNFINSDFNKALLNGTDLSNPMPMISNANFNAANFSGANFQSVTFTDSTLTDSIFDFSGRTIYIDENRQCQGSTKIPITNTTTTCPDGNKPTNRCTL